MNTLTVSGFRRNMAEAFNKAASGEDVMVRRGTQVFAIIPIADKKSSISTELQDKIDKARKEYSNGNYVSCATKEELDNFLDSL